MKKILLGAAALLASVLPIEAADTAYNQTLVNQVVTTTTPFVLDLSAYGIDGISFQAIVSSATPASKTFNDGHLATGTITVVDYTRLAAHVSSDTVVVATNTALSPTAGSNSLLLTKGASAWSGIAGSSFTIVTNSSHTFVIGVDISTNVVSSTQTAVSIAALLNTNVENITATVSGSSVIVTCSATGLFCNSYALNSTTNTISAASANFSGGNDNSYFTIGLPNVTYKFTQGSEWTQQAVASNTALSIVNAVNNVSYFTASTNTSTSVLIQTVSSGTALNAYTLTSSTGALAVVVSSFKGGIDNAVLCLAGTCLTQGTDFTAATSSAATGASIASAINGKAAYSGILVASGSASCPGCGVVYASATILTSGNFNYVMYSSTGSLSLSSTTLLAGTTAAYALNTATITIASHGYATGEEVLYTTGSAVAIGGLTTGTSYYVAVIDTNRIALSATSTGSFTGASAWINLTSTSTSGAHNFTLAPLALAGTAVLSWSQSNDGVYFSTAAVTSSNVTITTGTLASPYTAAPFGWDFGNVNYRYLRLNVAGPTPAGNGGFNTVVTGYGKRNSGR